MSVTFKFELGDEVKDTITNFSGVIVARIEWMNGCIRYVIQSRVRSKDSKPVDDTIDEQQLELLHKPKVKKEVAKKGGPKPQVSKFNNVRF